MGGCFGWLILAAAFIFMMVSLLRWFEQTSDAVDERNWSRLTILIVFPFAVWWYPSRVGANRPVPVPHHEPVRGFGKVSLTEPGKEAPAAPPPVVRVSDGPPPGTPKEFLGMPVIPPKKPGQKPPVDPDKLAKLRQKMIEQGMIKPESDNETTP